MSQDEVAEPQDGAGQRRRPSDAEVWVLRLKSGRRAHCRHMHSSEALLARTGQPVVGHSRQHGAESIFALALAVGQSQLAVQSVAWGKQSPRC